LTEEAGKLKKGKRQCPQKGNEVRRGRNQYTSPELVFIFPFYWSVHCKAI